MKIYILRHEERTKDCSFFSPLTMNGLLNSNKLIPLLEKEKINKIYCSPFIRTLQTIYPYSNKHNIKINLEYGLSETHHENIIPKQSIGLYLPEYLSEQFNYNINYKTLIEPTNITYPEREKDVEKRTKKVLKQIILDNYKTDNNIILVSHRTTCNIILKLANIIENNYPMGKLCLFFSNNGWTFSSLN
jgi:2,3-bisphosphoglycerate-dependent phosphoglycerate mutase